MGSVGEHRKKSLGEQGKKKDIWKQRGENVEEEHKLFGLKLLMVVEGSE